MRILSFRDNTYWFPYVFYILTYSNVSLLFESINVLKNVYSTRSGLNVVS